MRDYKLYLSDILDAMDSIERFVEGMGFEEFKRDDRTVSAVVRKFEIIGEASKNIPEEMRRNYPEIPWKEMSGMRNRLIHVYFKVDYNLVWTTIKDRIPIVKSLIKRASE